MLCLAIFHSDAKAIFGIFSFVHQNLDFLRTLRSRVVCRRLDFPDASGNMRRVSVMTLLHRGTTRNTRTLGTGARTCQQESH